MAEPLAIPRRAAARIALAESRRAWPIGVARFYAWSAGACGALIVAWAARRASAEGARSLADAATLSVTALPTALAAWSLAGRSGRDEAVRPGLVALARWHGASARDLGGASALAVARIVARAIVPPTALIHAAALVASRAHAVESPARALAEVAFAALVAMVAGACVAVARAIDPSRARRWLAALVLGPWALAAWLADAHSAPFWSVPGALGRAWDVLSAVSP